MQSDGKVLVGGSFSRIGSAGRTNLARFNADGTLDDTYTPYVNGTVWSIAIDADNTAFVGGDFTTIGGQKRSRLAKLRLDQDGAADAAWNPATIPNGGVVSALALDGAGRLYVGSSFLGDRPLRRLSTTGTGGFDPAWGPSSLIGNITSISIAPEESVYAAGSFYQSGYGERARMTGGAAHERRARCP